MKRKAMAEAPWRIVQQYPGWKCGDGPEGTASAVVAKQHEGPNHRKRIHYEDDSSWSLSADQWLNLSKLDFLRHALRAGQVLLHHQAMDRRGKRDQALSRSNTNIKPPGITSLRYVLPLAETQLNLSGITQIHCHSTPLSLGIPGVDRLRRVGELQYHV